MLDPVTIKKIEQFVYTKPRSIQEVAEHIQKNWRTADRYIEEIEKEYGTISTRVFRGGTRGALKIVFWSSIEKVSSNVFQEQLEQEIMRGRKKEDFSAFDIYQHIPEKKKTVEIAKGDDETSSGLEGLKDILTAVQKQIIIFSGNLSFINFKNKKIDTFKEIESLVKKRIAVKVITRIDIGGKENIETLLSLNNKYGRELIEIRHREQPIRAIIVDKEFFNIKEIKLPTGRDKELNKKLFLFYTIKDKEWVEWFTKIFWKMFSSSTNAEVRLREISSLKI